jgi:hypothetical protein
MSSKYFPSDAIDIATESPPQESRMSGASAFSMNDLIQQLQAADDYRDQIGPNGHRTFPEHLAEYGILYIYPLNSP